MLKCEIGRAAAWCSWDSVAHMQNSLLAPAKYYFGLGRTHSPGRKQTECRDTRRDRLRSKQIACNLENYRRPAWYALPLCTLRVSLWCPRLKIFPMKSSPQYCEFHHNFLNNFSAVIFLFIKNMNLNPLSILSIYYK